MRLFEISCQNILENKTEQAYYVCVAVNYTRMIKI